MNNFKFLILIQIFILFSGNLSYSQSQEELAFATNYQTNTPLFRAQHTHATLCDSLIDLYLKVDYNQHYVKWHKTKTIRIKVLNQQIGGNLSAHYFSYYNIPLDQNGFPSTGTTEPGHNQNGSSGVFNWPRDKPFFFELEFYKLSAPYNIITSSKTVNIEVSFISESNVVTSTNVITLNLKKEKGIVDVTDHLAEMLEGFNAQTDTAMMTYFCGKKISQIELLAYFQDFLGFTPEQMCEAIKIHDLSSSNYYNNTMLYTTNLTTHIQTILLCTFLELWQNGLRGGEEHNCLCKTIRTKADAANIVGTLNTYDDQCKNYEYKSFVKNWEGDWDGDDDDLMMLSGQLGAAKSTIFYINYDGCDDSPNTDGLRSPFKGYGEITFRSVCVNPATIKPEKDKCKGCTKNIELKYKYESTGEAIAKDKGVACWGGSSGYVTAEDFAAVIVNGSIVDTAGFKLLVECEVDGEWDIDTLLNKGLELFNVVKSVNTVETAVTAALAVSNVLKNVLKGGCGEIKQAYASFENNPSASNYILEPGETFNVKLFSEAIFKGRAKSSAWGHALIKSDYLLSAIVSSIPDSLGTVPEYCECEKIASYTWGSLESFTPPANRPRDNDNTDRQPNFDEMFQNPPMGDATIKQILGGFIGTAGEWGDKFETVPGGCCAVVIPCHADCVYILGCGDDDGRILNNSDLQIIETKNILSNDIVESQPIVIDTTQFKVSAKRIKESIKIYPNPADNNIIILIDKNTNDSFVESIEIYNSLGQLITKEKINDSNSSLVKDIDISSYSIGTYYVKVIYNNQVFVMSRFIKSN